MKKYNPILASGLDALEDRLQKAKSDFGDFSEAENFFWFIEVNAEKLGHISMHNINRQMLTAEIGYATASLARSRGVASLALKKISQAIFEHTPLRKLIAFVHEENLASIRVLEKAGYRREGRLRDHYLVGNVPVTELIYGLLTSEVKYE